MVSAGQNSVHMTSHLGGAEAPPTTYITCRFQLELLVPRLKTHRLTARRGRTRRCIDDYPPPASTRKCAHLSICRTANRNADKDRRGGANVSSERMRPTTAPTFDLQHFKKVALPFNGSHAADRDVTPLHALTCGLPTPHT